MWKYVVLRQHVADFRPLACPLADVVLLGYLLQAVVALGAVKPKFISENRERIFYKNMWEI